MLERRVRRTGDGATADYEKEDDSLAASHPTLVDFLTQARWPDGKPRATGTVMLVLDSGVAKAWVHDRDGREAAWVSSNTFWGLLEAIERGLREDSLEWRKDKANQGRGR